MKAIPSIKPFRMPLIASAMLAVTMFAAAPLEAKDKHHHHRGKGHQHHSGHVERREIQGPGFSITVERPRSDYHRHDDHVHTRFCGSHHHQHAHVWHGRDHADYRCPGHE